VNHPAFYELGRSGRLPSIYAGPHLADLEQLARILPPATYYILAVEDEGSEPWTRTDWGTLDVRGPDDWTLRSLAGLQAGPAYLCEPIKVSSA
jgi:hypothetical protein